jgi:protein-tyrosine phosphatase
MAVWFPTIEAVTELTRHVAFEACFNFRDLGGYATTDGRRVRWGTLFRSDTLHRLTTADVEEFRGLGLRTVIDLRSRTEIEDHGRVEVAEGTFIWHNVPMLDNLRLVPTPPDAAPGPEPASLAPGEGYVRMVEQFSESLGQVFTLLSQDGALPAVFHCTAGKDRTGIVAALILDLLGVPDDTITADYTLTEEAYERSISWIEVHEPDFAAYLAEIPYERRAARPEKITGFLALFRHQFGSAEQFLINLGVDELRLHGLRDRLLTN